MRLLVDYLMNNLLLKLITILARVHFTLFALISVLELSNNVRSHYKLSLKERMEINGKLSLKLK